MRRAKRAALDALRARFPWLGVAMAFWQCAPELWRLLANETGGKVSSPVVALLVMLSPLKQATLVLTDALDPMDEAEFRRMNFFWASIGRAACYQFIDAVRVSAGFDEFLTGCPVCGTLYSAPGVPACACASAPASEGST